MKNETLPLTRSRWASLSHRTRLVFAATALVTLAACGGGGSDNSTPTINSIAGVASKGPLNGSTICAFSIIANEKGSSLGPCTTNVVNGSFNLDVGSYIGPVLFEATGGTYIDEATGVSVPLTAPLRSMLINSTAGTNSVAITPLTELAYLDASSVVGGLTSARMLAAISTIQTNFGVSDIVSTLPVNALNVPTNATAEQIKYALALASISQYQLAQPVSTTLAALLAGIRACIASPSTGCGTGSANVGTALHAAQTNFKSTHPSLAGVTLPVTNFGSYELCRVGTPALYTDTYCNAYANTIFAGSTPSAANIAGATAAGSNVGNIGMGSTVTPIGTPLTPPPVGCVVDTTTGLTWESPTNATGTKAGASAYADAVNATALCGYTDWRLPNISELRNMASDTRNGMFGGYWSSTLYTIFEGASYWEILFVGVTPPDHLYGRTDFTYRVRLVR